MRVASCMLLLGHEAEMQAIGLNSPKPDPDLLAMGHHITLRFGILQHHLGTAFIFGMLPMRSWNPSGWFKESGSLCVICNCTFRRTRAQATWLGYN